jgi:hypothetical protein
MHSYLFRLLLVRDFVYENNALIRIFLRKVCVFKEEDYSPVKVVKICFYKVSVDAICMGPLRWWVSLVVTGGEMEQLGHSG